MFYFKIPCPGRHRLRCVGCVASHRGCVLRLQPFVASMDRKSYEPPSEEPETSKPVTDPLEWKASYGNHFCHAVKDEDDDWVKAMKGKFARGRVLYAEVLDDCPEPKRMMDIAIDYLGIAISAMRLAGDRWWTLTGPEASMIDYFLHTAVGLGHDSAQSSCFEKKKLVEPYECCTKLRPILTKIAVACKRFNKAQSKKTGVRVNLWRIMQDRKRELQMESASMELEAYMRGQAFVPCDTCGGLQTIALGVMQSPEAAMIQIAEKIAATAMRVEAAAAEREMLQRQSRVEGAAKVAEAADVGDATKATEPKEDDQTQEEIKTEPPTRPQQPPSPSTPDVDYHKQL